MGKSFLKSKTLWVNLLAFLALVVQGLTGFVISPEMQLGGLAVVNFLLRLVTRQPVEW